MAIIVTLVLAALPRAADAAPDPGYYDSAQGLTGQALKAELHDIISVQTRLS